MVFATELLHFSNLLTSDTLLRFTHTTTLYFALSIYIQNTAVRLVVRERKSAHITPVLSNLHWLPVQQRVIFKLLLVTYKALNGIAPTYITDLLRRHIPARTLRSSSQNLLTVPRVRTETYGEKSFSCAAPRLWNNLPDSIKQSPTIDEFKAKLKTYLFRIAFTD